MRIAAKRLTETAIIPFRHHATDAGLDLFSDEVVSIYPNHTDLVQTNIAIEIPFGFVGDVRPRSGLTLKTALRVQYGTIDSGYRGGIGIICENIGDEVIQIEKGVKLAQLVILPAWMESLTEVDELKKADRGESGFGSTGFSEMR